MTNNYMDDWVAVGLLLLLLFITQRIIYKTLKTKKLARKYDKIEHTCTCI